MGGTLTSSPMSFSVKLAPGVRIRASSRGVRTSIGPRAARVHVGSGRTGFSSGVGPFSVYTSVGGKRRPTARSSRPSPAPLQRQAAATRRTQAEADKARGSRVSPRSSMRSSTCTDTNSRPSSGPSLRCHRCRMPTRFATGMKNALHGIGVFHRAGRTAAKQYAAAAAQAELNNLWQRAQTEQARAQAELDQQWARLVNNDLDTVLATLSEAFEDNEAPTAPIGHQRRGTCDGGPRAERGGDSRAAARNDTGGEPDTTKAPEKRARRALHTAYPRPCAGGAPRGIRSGTRCQLCRSNRGQD